MYGATQLDLEDTGFAVNFHDFQATTGAGVRARARAYFRISLCVYRVTLHTAAIVRELVRGPWRMALCV